jgi:hypothetical protein
MLEIRDDGMVLNKKGLVAASFVESSHASRVGHQRINLLELLSRGGIRLDL